MAEYLTMTPSFKEEIKKVDEQYAAEAKSRKQLLKEMGSVVEAADGAGEDLEVWEGASEEEEEEEDNGFQHMLVGEKPEVAPENKTAKAAKLREQVLQFKKAAQRKVRVVQFIYLLIQLLI
ncbi:unnamed protein product [Durusdinium trenchii]|uniref:Uncharacterized protein n=1 Tax=Durusdinium trenchii TaxID=1381693 RepID=A0ABP0KTU5_9DINO